jgi:hypothetical protein
MTSLVHHVPRFGRRPAPGARCDLVVVRARGHLRVGFVTVAVVVCLLVGAMLTVAAVAAVAGIDAHGRIPHPEPLPAPTGRSLAGN